MYVQNITSPSAKCPITLGHINLELYLHRSVFSHCTKDVLLRVSRVWKSFARLLERNFVVLKLNADSFWLNIGRELRVVGLKMYSRREHFTVIYSLAYRSVERNSLPQATTLPTCIPKASGSSFCWDPHYHRRDFPWLPLIPANQSSKYASNASRSPMSFQGYWTQPPIHATRR